MQRVEAKRRVVLVRFTKHAVRLETNRLATTVNVHRVEARKRVVLVQLAQHAVRVETKQLLMR